MHAEEVEHCSLLHCCMKAHCKGFFSLGFYVMHDVLLIGRVRNASTKTEEYQENGAAMGLQTAVPVTAATVEQSYVSEGLQSATVSCKHPLP